MQLQRHAPKAQSLDRILGLLASYSILTSSCVPPTPAYTTTAHADISTTLYGLTPICKHLFCGAAFASSAVLANGRAHLEAWGRVDEALLDPEDSPFFLAQKKDFFTYAKEDPQFGTFFNNCMADLSQAFMERLLYKTNYGGFGGISSLVDVGGNLGGCIHQIVLKHPHIKGINFDLPHVIEEARRQNAYPGIEHIGGNMFESIPRTDAVFLKHILHDWTDEDCIKILKSCHDTLPMKGKVIVIDVALPTRVQADLVGKVCYQMDLVMYTLGGKERTVEEFAKLAGAAGFTTPRVVCRVNHASVMEFFKL